MDPGIGPQDAAAHLVQPKFVLNLAKEKASSAEQPQPQIKGLKAESLNLNVA